MDFSIREDTVGIGQPLPDALRQAEDEQRRAAALNGRVPLSLRSGDTIHENAVFCETPRLNQGDGVPYSRALFMDDIENALDMDKIEVDAENIHVLRQGRKASELGKALESRAVDPSGQAYTEATAALKRYVA